MKLFFNLKETDYKEKDRILTFEEYYSERNTDKRMWYSFKTKFTSEKEFRKMQKAANSELRKAEMAKRLAREEDAMKKYEQGLIKPKPKKEKSFPPFVVLDFYDPDTNFAYYRFDFENKRN